MRSCSPCNQAAYGSSNIISTTADMLQFDAAFFGGRLLRKSSMEEALTPIKLNNDKVHTEHMDTMLGEGELTGSVTTSSTSLRSKITNSYRWKLLS